MDAPQTAAGRDLLRRHPELEADEIGTIELEAQGRRVKADSVRRERVVDLLRHLLTPAQLGAVHAVLTLDPEASPHSMMRCCESFSPDCLIPD